MTNRVLATDSYKQSNFLQYPPEARKISAYIEARPNPFSEDLIFFGLQAYLIDHLAEPIRAADIDEAEAICAAHGVPFNRAGWDAILTDHGGFLPLAISALPEGTIVPTGVPLIQVENIDDRMPWLSTFIETALLRAVWYPSTVATLSGKAKRIIHAGLAKSSDDPMGQLPFKLHDFGARGVSSGESAALGGLAHLVNFQCTDTMEALIAARRFYGADMAGFSIPAAEHSTMTSWGRDREEEAYANMLDRFKRGGGTVAVVSDSYNFDYALKMLWGENLRDRVLAEGGTVIIRPDSGDPVGTPVRALDVLWEKFGGSINGKGYRILNSHVRLVQGDGMHLNDVATLIDRVTGAGFAVDNISFGMGGRLLQGPNRDTLRFAMKADAMQSDDGVWHDVQKAPATDPGKASKAGRQAVVLDDGRLVARRVEDVATNLLEPVWRGGELLKRTTLAEVRERAERGLLG